LPLDKYRKYKLDLYRDFLKEKVNGYPKILNFFKSLGRGHLEKRKLGEVGKFLMKNSLFGFLIALIMLGCLVLKLRKIMRIFWVLMKIVGIGFWIGMRI
jgi:hypothetical protein